MKRTKKVLSAVVALLLAMTVVFSLTVPALAEGYPPAFCPVKITDQNGKTVATYKHDKSARKITCEVTDGALLKNIEIYPFVECSVEGGMSIFHAMAPDSLDWKMLVLLEAATSERQVGTYVFNHKDASGNKTFTETFTIRHDSAGIENVGVDYKKVTANNKISKSSMNVNGSNYYYSYDDGSSKEYHVDESEESVHVTQTIRKTDGKTTTNTYGCSSTRYRGFGNITKNGTALNAKYTFNDEDQYEITMVKDGEYLSLVEPMVDMDNPKGEYTWTYTKNGKTAKYRCSFYEINHADRRPFNS